MNEEQNRMLVPTQEDGRVFSAIDFGLGSEPEDDQQASSQHLNFIESNTAGITLQELVTKCIVPTFSGNRHETVESMIAE